MRSALAIGFVAGWLAAAPAMAQAPAQPGNRARAREQVEFGVKVAQKGLWNEALFRFEKAVALDPGYAAAYNDLAIACERDGQLDRAKEAYEKALELEPKNLHIKQNFDYFKEIHERAKGRPPGPG